MKVYFLPSEIEGIQWTGNNAKQIANFAPELEKVSDTVFKLTVINHLALGDYILKDTQDSLIVCQLSLFNKKFSLVPEQLPVAVATLRSVEALPTETFLAQEKKKILPYRDHLRQYLLELLEHTGGNVTEAKYYSGISRATLHNWIDRFDLQKERSEIQGRARRMKKMRR